LYSRVNGYYVVPSELPVSHWRSLSAVLTVAELSCHEDRFSLSIESASLLSKKDIFLLRTFFSHQIPKPLKTKAVFQRIALPSLEMSRKSVVRIQREGTMRLSRLLIGG